MSEYTYRENIYDFYGNAIGCQKYTVPNMIVEQIKADAIDEFSYWLVEQGILGNRVIADGEITDYGKVYAKRFKEQSNSVK